MKDSNTIPPKLAQRLLGTFLRDDLLEEVSGDLEEKYQVSLKNRSKFSAKLNYWYQVLHYVRPFAIRKLNVHPTIPYPMYRSYFKTALRSMVKNKLHSFINMAGLSVGMTVAVTIALWINDELSFEKKFERYDRISQVIQNVTNNGEVDTWMSVPYPLAEELRKNYGGDFQYIALTSGKYPHLLSTETKKLSKVGLYAEPDFTEILTLRMLKGKRNVIKDQSSILISQSTATTYFGDADPIGEVMTIDQELTVHVAGVYEDIPSHSVFSDMQFIAAWDLLYNGTEWIKTMSDPWRPNAFSVFVALADHATVAGASEKIKDAKLKKVSKELAKKKPELFLFPMSDWHLYSDFKNGKQAGGRIQYVWLFGIVGVFVVLMACINFMNLSTARSEKRAKEVGIRKSVGSYRGQLIAQFFSESILTALFSLAIALLLVQLMLPMFNQIADKNISLPWREPLLWLVGIGFCITIGLIAGSYPALYLSAINVSSVLKGVFKAGRSAALPRKVLVVVQFTVSVVLIIGTAIIFRQIQFAKDRPMGYSSSGVISVPVISQEVHKHFDAVKQELVNAGAIVEMAEATSPTTEIWSTSSGFDWKGKDPDLSVDFPNTAGSHDFGKTIGWEITDGRDFNREFASDSSAVIINESAVRYMGLTNPVGETIRWSGQPLTVIGVIKDIIARSPYERVRPTIYYLSGGAESFVILKINPKVSTSEALTTIESTFKKYNTEEPFTYQFADEAYAWKFGSEERVGKLASVFAFLAVFISCLGIFGLSSFVAEQRTKEIGVRKVMGASRFDLWRLISKDFIVLVILSCCIAIPIAYKVLSMWLDGYQYHIGVPWWIFLAAVGGTLLITIITVSWHTLSAANLNPVKSLRSE